MPGMMQAESLQRWIEYMFSQPVPWSSISLELPWFLQEPEVLSIKVLGFGNHRNDNWFRQRFSMDVKIVGSRFGKQQESRTVLKVLPHRLLIIYKKGKQKPFQWRNLVGTTV